MNRNHHRENPSEKNRMREEIDKQIRAFLQRGGKIDVLDESRGNCGRSNAIGSVWHTDELPGLAE